MEHVKVPGGLVPTLPSPRRPPAVVPPRRPAAAAPAPAAAAPARSRSPRREDAAAAPAASAPAPAALPPEVVPSNTVALFVDGFKEDALDGWYRRRDKCIITGSPAFFHANQGGSAKLFMYKQLSGRWVISPVRSGKGGEDDLLRAARQGEDRGVACQKAARGSFNNWREFYQGRWVEVKLNVEMFNFEQYEREKRRSRDGGREERQAALPSAPAAPLPSKAEAEPNSSSRMSELSEKDVQKMLLAAQAETKQKERSEILEQQKEMQLKAQQPKASPKPKATSSLLAAASKLHAPPEAGFMSAAVRSSQVQKEVDEWGDRLFAEESMSSATPKQPPQAGVIAPPSAPPPLISQLADPQPAQQMLLTMPCAGYQPMPPSQMLLQADGTSSWQQLPPWQAQRNAPGYESIYGGMPIYDRIYAATPMQDPRGLPPPPPPPPPPPDDKARAPQTPPKSGPKGKGKKGKADHRPKSSLGSMPGKGKDGKDKDGKGKDGQGKDGQGKDGKDNAPRKGNFFQGYQEEDAKEAFHKASELSFAQVRKEPLKAEQPAKASSQQEPDIRAEAEKIRVRIIEKMRVMMTKEDSEEIKFLQTRLECMQNRIEKDDKKKAPAAKAESTAATSRALEPPARPAQPDSKTSTEEQLVRAALLEKGFEKTTIDKALHPLLLARLEKATKAEEVAAAKVKSRSPETQRVRSFLQRLNGEKNPAKERPGSSAQKPPEPAGPPRANVEAQVLADDGERHSDDSKGWNQWKDDRSKDDWEGWESKGWRQDWSDWDDWRWRSWSRDGDGSWRQDYGGYGDWKEDKAKKKEKKEEKKEKKEKKKNKEKEKQKDSPPKDTAASTPAVAEGAAGLPRPPGFFGDAQGQGQQPATTARQSPPATTASAPAAGLPRPPGFFGDAQGQGAAKAAPAGEDPPKEQTEEMPKVAVLIPAGVNAKQGFPATVAGFYGFLVERESIRRRRERGDAWPWTADPILRHLRVRNVRRIHNRSNLLMRRLLSVPPMTSMQNHLAQCLWNVCLWRKFGSLHFINKLGFVPMPQDVKDIPDLVEVASDLWRSGLPACTDAYGPAMRCHGLELAAWHSTASDLAQACLETPSARRKRRRLAVTEDGLRQVKKAYGQLWNTSIAVHLAAECSRVYTTLLTPGSTLESISHKLASVGKQGSSNYCHAAELLQDFLGSSGILLSVQADVSKLALDAPTKRCLRQIMPRMKMPPNGMMGFVYEQRKDLWPKTIEEEPTEQLDIHDVRSMLVEFDRYLRAIDGKPTRMPFTPSMP